MKTKISGILFIIAFVVCCITNGKAQENKKPMPDEVKWLQKFVGKWMADISMTDAEKKVHKVKSYLAFHSIADGSGIYGEESGDDPEMGHYRASDLLGYDPFDKKFHCYSVDNMGTCHDHICEWKSQDQFYMEHNSMRDGKKYQEKITMVFKSKDALDFSLSSSLDGQVSETMTGTYKKAK